MIVLVANYTAEPGNGAQVVGLLGAMALLVKEKEPGCALYQVSVNRNDPDSIIIYEHYQDEAALAAHRDTPHFQSYILDQIVPLLEERAVAFYDLAIG